MSIKTKKIKAFPALALTISMTFGLAGCGVTKLWGNDEPLTQNAVVQGPTLREQSAELAETAWEVEGKGSFMSQMAGILVNGARSAGEALDVFDWTESESAETRQAKQYIQQLGTEDPDEILAAVLEDIHAKNTAASAFRVSGIAALDRMHEKMKAAADDTLVRKDEVKRIFAQADEDRRATIQASKSLRLQASIFEATGAVLAIKDEALDVSSLKSEVGQLRLHADELRSLAGDFDLD